MLTLHLNRAVTSKSTLLRLELLMNVPTQLTLLSVSVKPASIALSQMFPLLLNSNFPSMFHAGHFVDVMALQINRLKISRCCFNLQKGVWKLFLIWTLADRLTNMCVSYVSNSWFLNKLHLCYSRYETVLVLLGVVAPFIIDCEPLLFRTAVLWLEGVLYFNP